jgi:hypothetical protein
MKEALAFTVEAFLCRYQLSVIHARSSEAFHAKAAKLKIPEGRKRLEQASKLCKSCAAGRLSAVVLCSKCILVIADFGFTIIVNRYLASVNVCLR